MRVYLSVPMVLNRELGRAGTMAKAIRDAGHVVSSPWVLGPLEKQDPSVLNVFDRDMKGAETSDVLVADVSRPSIGVGMEIMAAYKANRRIILVAKKGTMVSRMLLHMDGKETIGFETERQIYDGLLKALSQSA